MFDKRKILMMHAASFELLEMLITNFSVKYVQMNFYIKKTSIVSGTPNQNRSTAFYLYYSIAVY